MKRVLKAELKVDSLGTRGTAQLDTILDGGIYDGPVPVTVDGLLLVL